MKELSAKQKKFVHEWLIDLCGTRAAIRAGYSEKSAAQTASRLMKDPAVREYRDALLKEEFDSLGHHPATRWRWRCGGCMSGALPPRRCCNGTAICGTTLRAETGNLTLKAA